VKINVALAKWLLVHSTQLKYSHEKELTNKNVFSCLLNTVNVGAQVTLRVGSIISHKLLPKRNVNHAKFCSPVTLGSTEINKSMQLTNSIIVKYISYTELQCKFPAAVFQHAGRDEIFYATVMQDI